MCRETAIPRNTAETLLLVFMCQCVYMSRFCTCDPSPARQSGTKVYETECYANHCPSEGKTTSSTQQI